MSRLTRYCETKDEYVDANFGKDWKSSINIYNKLGQLEDIEEELGIDLITYFKIKNAEKVFVKEEYQSEKGWNTISEMLVRPSKASIDVCYKGFVNIPECDERLYLKDYGKTWALTKKELK